MCQTTQLLHYHSFHITASVPNNLSSTIICGLFPSERCFWTARPDCQEHARDGQPSVQYVHAHDPDLHEVQTGKTFNKRYSEV